METTSFAILPRTDGFVPKLDDIVEAGKQAKIDYWRNGQTPDLAPVFAYVGEAGTLFMPCKSSDVAEAVSMAVTMVGRLKGLIFQMETFMQETDQDNEPPVCESCGLHHGDPDEFQRRIDAGDTSVETAFVTFRWAIGDPIEFRSVTWTLADNGCPEFGRTVDHNPDGYIPEVFKAAVATLVE